MATCNFWTMKRFNLVVADNETVMDLYRDDDYRDDDCNQEIDPYTLSAYYDFFVDDIEEDLNIINNQLDVFKVKLKSGYYEGIQFYIDESNVDLFELEEDSWDDDDVYYTFHVDSKELLKEKIKKETDLTQSWLMDMKRSWGLKSLVCLGVFSNGEAIYEVV